jgi:Fe-S-cluster containining protein
VSAAAELRGENGVCKHLEGNLCGIYANRPLACNVEQMYLQYFKDFMSEDEFIKMNLKSCMNIALLHGAQDIANFFRKRLQDNRQVPY